MTDITRAVEVLPNAETLERSDMQRVRKLRVGQPSMLFKGLILKVF
jgi:hypothetical protein